MALKAYDAERAGAVAKGGGAKGGGELSFSARAVAHCRQASTVAAFLVAAVALTVLVGWMLRLPALIALVPGTLMVKANTAVGLLLAAASLWLLRQPEGRGASRRQLAAARACAFAAGAIGAATLLEYLLGVDFGIDEALVLDFANAAETSSPGRMSPITAIALVVLALAELSLDRPWPGASRVAQGLALATPVLPALSLLGYLYDVPALYGMFRGSQIAVTTAVCFSLLGVGVAALRPTAGWMRAATADGVAGRMVRGLLPVTLFGPVLVGWLRLEGQRNGFYGTEFGIALQVLTTSLMLGVVIAALGTVLGREERFRMAAEASLAAKEAQLRLAVKSAQLGTWDWDIVSGRLDWSERCREIFGVPPGEPMSYEQFVAALHPDDREPTNAAVSRSLAERSPYDLEFRAIWPDESVHWIAAKGLGDYDEQGTAVRMRGAVIDITERKQREQEREALLAALDIRTRELEQVVYVASHDLRSPLVNIQGFGRELASSLGELTELLSEAAIPEPRRARLEAILERDVPEALSYVQGGATRMDALLRGLLELSRAGRSAPAMKPVDMRALVGGALADLEYELERRGVTVRVGELPPCLGDAGQLAQVFANLLGNALKFLEPARPGRIEVDAERRGGWVVYRVRDNGIGIAPAHQGKIFEVFHRLDPARSEGDGLGLAIVQKIVGLHGGRVWVESAPGAGSSFHVELRAVRSEKERQ